MIEICIHWFPRWVGVDYVSPSLLFGHQFRLGWIILTFQCKKRVPLPE